MVASGPVDEPVPTIPDGAGDEPDRQYEQKIQCAAFRGVGDEAVSASTPGRAQSAARPSVPISSFAGTCRALGPVPGCSGATAANSQYLQCSGPISRSGTAPPGFLL